MGKRSEFERIERDHYATPWEAMRFLAPFLPPSFTFCEPCAAEGQLIRWLSAMGGTCRAAYDIHPLAPHVAYGNALHMLGHHLNGAELIVTNPPWDRAVLHPLLLRFSRLAPAWILLDANWMFTDQAVPFMGPGRNVVHKIVAVGRLQWIPETEFTGKDDACWYLIGRPRAEPPEFYPRP